MPTIKQKKVFEKVVKGSNISTAMRQVGYSEETAKRTNKITNSDGWKELLDKHIPDRKLAKVLDEGLDAGKRIFKNNNESGEIEDMGIEADYAVRHKYLETGLKLKNRFPKEQLNPEGAEGLKNLIIVVNNILDGQGRATIKDI